MTSIDVYSNTVPNTYESGFPELSKQQKPMETPTPELGVCIGNPQKKSCSELFRTVSRVSLATICIGGTVLLATASIAATAIACASVIAAYIIAKVAIAIFRCFKNFKYRIAFEPGINNPAAPKLGIYSQQDLRISNNAAESFEWKKKLISSAKKSIELSPNFAGGEYLREVLALIEKRMEECKEVKTHLIISSDLLEKEDKEMLEQLKEKFGSRFNYLITNRIYTTVPTVMSEENHMKMLIVDEEYCSTGGTGIHKKMGREEAPADEATKGTFASKFIDGAFRDTDLFCHGNLAGTMRNQFFNLYRIWEHRTTGNSENRYFEVTGEKGICEAFHNEEGLVKDCKTKFIVCGPEHRRNNPITNEMVQLFNGAKNEIKIANLLFNPDKKIKNALKNKKKRKVKIKGYFNGTAKSSSASHHIYAIPNRSNYNCFSSASEFQKANTLYHKKVTTVDKRFCVIGTFNFGIKSDYSDYESVCVIDDPRIASIVNDGLKQDRKHSKKFKGCSLFSKHTFSLISGYVLNTFLGPFFG